jgi:hypothetical protein
MTVDTVIGNIENTVFKPFVMRRIALIENLAERLAPLDVLPGLVGPETFVVLFCLFIQFVQISRLDTRVAHEIGWRVETTIFDQDGIYFII